MKKILFLSNRGLLPIVDGHTRRSFNILKGLSENHSVHYLSLYENKEEISNESIDELKSFCNEVEFYKSPSKKFSFEMLWRLLFSLFTLDPYTSWRHYSYSFKKRVDDLLKTGKYDIVHCDILPLFYTIKKERNTYKSLTDHDVSYKKCLTLARSRSNLFVKIFLLFEAVKLKRLEKIAFNNVDLGIVVSESDKKELTRISPKGNFLVVENGVDLGGFKKGEVNIEIQVKNPKDCQLVWLGGFKHYSNKQAISYFLKDVYPLIKKNIPSVSINIIGGGLTEDLVNISRFDSSIKFKGFVDDPLYYLRNSDVFVAPILSGGGTKLKVLEAMAAGKAVVTTPVGSEGIDGVTGEHYLVAVDTAGFVDAVCKLHNDKDFLYLLGVNANKFITERYDNEKVVKKLSLCYGKIN